MGACGDGAKVAPSLPGRHELAELAFEGVGAAKEGLTPLRMVRRLASFPKLGGGGVEAI